jgi:hypothetical protein
MKVVYEHDGSLHVQEISSIKELPESQHLNYEAALVTLGKQQQLAPLGNYEESLISLVERYRKYCERFHKDLQVNGAHKAYIPDCVQARHVRGIAVNTR